jgi:hypothetical protein
MLPTAGQANVKAGERGRKEKEERRRGNRLNNWRLVIAN